MQETLLNRSQKLPVPCSNEANLDTYKMREHTEHFD